jgi:hypothetical protein
MIDIKHYKPGRFEYLIGNTWAIDLWNFLTAQEHIQAMETAISAGKPAIEPLLFDIEARFEKPLVSKEYHDDDVCVLVNNMIKQILGMRGYELISCGLCPQGRFIKQSGMYAKVQ